MKQEREIGMAFPLPVGRELLKRKFTQEENKAFENVYKDGTFSNEGNIRSVNNYVLDDYKGLKNLKKFFEKAVNNFMLDVYHPTNEIEFFITQSWMNWAEKDMWHNRHLHPNSYLSGVFYISCIEEDKLCFYNAMGNNMLHALMEINKEDFNIFNSSKMTFDIKAFDLILFPSFMVHEVELNPTDTTRISLAFNTWVKGTIGSNFALTEVKTRSCLVPRSRSQGV